MTCLRPTLAPLLSGCLLLAACGDDGGEAGTGASTDSSSGETASTSEASESSATASGDGDGDGDPTGDGDGDPTGDGDGDGDPTGDGDGDGDLTGDGDGDPTGDGDGDPTGDGDGDLTGDGDGDDECLDAELACDGIDEDCNGIIDDLDVGDDGFCDCYRIGIIGNKGSNPGANFEAWLQDKGTTATRFGTMGDHELTEADLAEIDILIVDRLTHAYSPAENALLQAWLAEGHGMITMAGYAGDQGDINRQNSLASASGLSYAGPLYIDPTEVWLPHPISEGAEAVQVYGGWQVTGPGEVFVRPQGENDTALGTTADVGEGKAIVFSDEWISFDSEWQMIPEVEVFWSNMVQWVGPTNICVEPQ